MITATAREETASSVTVQVGHVTRTVGMLTWLKLTAVNGACLPLNLWFLWWIMYASLRPIGF